MTAAELFLLCVLAFAASVSVLGRGKETHPLVKILAGLVAYVSGGAGLILGLGLLLRFLGRL